MFLVAHTRHCLITRFSKALKLEEKEVPSRWKSPEKLWKKRHVIRALWEG